MKIELTKERKAELVEFCRHVKISFKDLSLLDKAFYHRSSLNELKLKESNERLEFLGDSVLGMITASYLYRNLNAPEGDLSKIKSAVVSEKALAPVALTFGIDRLLILGKGEEKTGGRTKPAILADCMEAIIGAYYLDSGFEKTEKYVLSFIEPGVNEILKNGMKDYKSLLQEYTQKEFKCAPKYNLISKTGPEHAIVFTVNAVVKEKEYGPAQGKTIKEAEQNAAKMALKAFNILYN